MPIAIKAPPWSTPEEIAAHDEELQQFEALQIQRYGSASYQFWSRAIPIAFGIIITAVIIYCLSLT